MPDKIFGELRKVGRFIRREAPIVQKAIRRGIITSRELTAEGLIYLEKEKVGMFQALKRPLTPEETSIVEHLNRRITRLDKVVSKAKEKLEKLKKEEGKPEEEIYTEKPPEFIVTYPEYTISYPEIEARSREKLEEVV
jgi:hypothetical protein